MSAMFVFPVAVLLLILWRKMPVKRKKGLPYRSRKSLLSPAELRFFHALVAAVPSSVRVQTKVRLADLVSWPRNAWREYGAPVSGKHLDFVLMDDSARIV